MIEVLSQMAPMIDGARAQRCMSLSLYYNSERYELETFRAG